MMILSCWNGFHPLRELVHSQQYILVAIRLWKLSYEVDTPAVKYFDCQNGRQRYLIASGQTTQHLISCAGSTKGIGVFEDCRPIKSIAQDFFSSLLRGKMSPTSLRVTIGQNGRDFIIQHTPTHYLISAILEQVGIFEVEMARN